MIEDIDTDFLYFEDIINQDILALDWIDVALSGSDLIPLTEKREEKISIYPILIPNDPNQKEAILEQDSWISGWENVPHILEYNKKEILENEQYYYETKGVQIIQFLCNYNSKYPITLRPDFSEELELVFDESKREYRNKENKTIVKIREKKISMRLDYLKEYLFRKNLLLVRNFDCRRKVKIPSTITMGKTRDDKAIKDNARAFWISLGEDKMYFDNIGHTDSRLIGKNIIFPMKMLQK